MDPEPLITENPRDAEAVRDFFNGWNLYRRIVENDYLCHDSVRQALSGWLDGLERPFSFLDLGCGDAAFSTGILKGRNLASYTGMDLSPVALDLARGNTRKIAAPVSLVHGDFVTEIGTLPASYDVIYLGLSLHHLSRTEKEFFFGELRRRTAPGGALLVCDPILSPGEVRDVFMGRWVDHAKWTWKALTIEEIDGAVEHVTTADFPEEIGTLNRMAVGAGFRPAEVLFTDRSDFYALMAFGTAPGS
jgi:SAM-dependent methyltransferase